MGSVMTLRLWVMYSTISLSAARFTSFHFRSLRGSDRKSKSTQHCRSFWMNSFSCSAGATSVGQGKGEVKGQRSKQHGHVEDRVQSNSVWVLFCSISFQFKPTPYSDFGYEYAIGACFPWVAKTVARCKNWMPKFREVIFNHNQTKWPDSVQCYGTKRSAMNHAHYISH